MRACSASDAGASARTSARNGCKDALKNGLSKFTVPFLSLTKSVSQGPAVLADCITVGPRAPMRGVHAPSAETGPAFALSAVGSVHLPRVSRARNACAFPHRHRRVLPLRPLRLSLVHPEARSNSQQRSGSAAFRMGIIPKRVTDTSAQRSGRSQGARSTTFSPARAPWRPLPQSLDQAAIPLEAGVPLFAGAPA